MVTCTRRLTFCAGHRVMGHEGKCAHPHGHNYVVHLVAECADGNLDELGRVVDFSVLKQRIGLWIEEHWDHGFIYCQSDCAVAAMLEAFDDARGEETAMSKRFALPYNPTAENLARYLLEAVCTQNLDGTGARVVRVVVEETENCRAEAT